MSSGRRAVVPRTADGSDISGSIGARLWYLLAVLAITFTITFALRALPFGIISTLKESSLVHELSGWMLVGILGILAVIALRGSVLPFPETILYALIALAATIAVHIFVGRRMLLSVTVGTVVYVRLVNLL